MTNAKKYYSERGAEKLLGLSAYTLARVSRKHPLPQADAIVDGRPVWEEAPLREWYKGRPQWGGDRKSVKFKEQQQK